MEKISGIKAIAFDTDGTLVDFEKVMHHSLGLVLAELERHYPGACKAMDTGRMIEIRDSVAREPAYKKSTMEEIRMESFRRIVGASGRPDETLAVHLYNLYMKHRFEDIELYEDVLPVLSELKGTYTLGLHSNGNSYPETWGLGGFFDFTLFSRDCGMSKPEPDFYRLVLEKAGCSPDKLLNIGDSLHNDVQAARTVGIPGIWLNRKGEPDTAGIGCDFEIASLSELLELLR